MIIDASVAFKALVAEEGTTAAQAVIGENEGVAPHLILSEIGNALWKATRRGELQPDNAGFALSIVPRLLSIVDEGVVMPRAAEMAIQLAHPIYDCVYLALAERRGVRLVTADLKFLRRVAGTPFEKLVEELAG